jgi:galactose mutarotase-like enzyme
MTGRDVMGAEIRLEHGVAVAAIKVIGGEPCAWSVAGRDLLWQGDARSWPQSAPILFPIVGRLRHGRVRIGRDVFAMGVHGFARSRPFTVVECAADHVRLSLTHDAETMAAYPLLFALMVDYRLTDTTFSAEFIVDNPGNGPLPYALGFHPGFRWPFAGGNPEQYAVVFEQDETADVPVITADGLISCARRPVPLAVRSLPLSHDLLADEALCFLHARSRAVRFVAPDGSAIGVAAEDFPHIALWSRPPAPFLCVESWTGHADPDDFEGDITSKPSMRYLAPGARARHTAHLSFHEAGGS